MRSLLIIFSVLLVLFSLHQAQATIIHVPADSSTIQSGLNGAVDGDTVLVAEGHYYERINFQGKRIFVSSEFMDDGDTLHIKNTVIDADTLVLGVVDTGSVVIFRSGENSTSVILGFTIQNGIGTLDTLDNCRRGGGIYCQSSNPNIRHCKIIDNSASDQWWAEGGGICCKSSNPIITRCTINGNSAGCYGGGIHCFSHSSPIIDSCVISGNFVGNFNSTLGGGGISCLSYSSPTITNCTISANVSEGEYYGDGGGVFCHMYSSPTITHCVISANTAQGRGGGIGCFSSCSPLITYCTITGNSAEDDGGGIYCYGAFGHYGAPTIISCTINGNSSGAEGGGISCYWNTNPTITNSILWGDTAATGAEIALRSNYYPSRLNILCSNVEGGQAAAHVEVGCTLNWGDGNIDCDPIFCYPDTGNYYLTDSSCCKGAGCDSLGNPDSTVDIGAFGVGCSPSRPPNPFSLLSPHNKAYLLRVVHFDWEDATDPDPGDQVEYDLYVSTTYQFPPGSTTIESNITKSEYVKAFDAGIYYWKVKAKDIYGAETWSKQICYFIVTGIVVLPADFNEDGFINLGDVVFAISYLYKTSTAPNSLEVGDVDCNGNVDLGDVVYLINYLFKGGPPPCN